MRLTIEVTDTPTETGQTPEIDVRAPASTTAVAAASTHDGGADRFAEPQASPVPGRSAAATSDTGTFDGGPAPTGRRGPSASVPTQIETTA
jgi:hypothetical protein